MKYININDFPLQVNTTISFNNFYPFRDRFRNSWYKEKYSHFLTKTKGNVSFLSK